MNSKPESIAQRAKSRLLASRERTEKTPTPSQEPGRPGEPQKLRGVVEKSEDIGVTSRGSDAVNTLVLNSILKS